MSGNRLVQIHGHRNEVAAKAGNGITEETIWDIYAGESSLDIAGWQRIDQALRILTEKDAAER